MKNLLTGPTKCLIARPEFLENTFYNLSTVFRTLGARSAAPPLGALIVAAMLPKHWEIRFIDADVTPLTDADLRWADIVMLSGIGPQQETMARAIKRAHEFGKPVVVGGAGPTIQPEFFVGKADYVVVGEAENVIPKLLEDLGNGVASGVYRATESADLKAGVIPRYDLARLDQYLFIGVNYVRGCPFSCEYCMQIEIFGRKPRTKTVDQVIGELQTLYDLGYRGMIDLGYDNLIGDLASAEAVLTAMAEWARAHDHPFYYSSEATMNLAKQPKLLSLMRDNDFRYIFVGIESGEDHVLEQTRKGQNTAMSPIEAVRIFNSYGLIINTGIIVGFDSETSQTAERTLDMVQNTGAFPALVLPLHALPKTQLAARLAREGRLFGGGMVMNTDDRTDTATTGLNFVTTRPRTEILADLAHVLEELYDPTRHYARTKLTARQLKPSQKHKPSAREFGKMVGTFARIVRSIGIDPETRGHFWPALIRTLLTNPAAIEMVVGQSVFHANYAGQARTYVQALREEIALVQSVGEVAFNAQRLKGTEAHAQPA